MVITNTSFKSICKLEASVFVCYEEINTSPLFALETGGFFIETVKKVLLHKFIHGVT